MTNEQQFRLLWSHLAETGGNSEEEAAKDIGVAHETDCIGYNCEICPVFSHIIDSPIYRCYDYWLSPFVWWRDCDNPKQRKIYAKFISELPWIEPKEEE